MKDELDALHLQVPPWLFAFDVVFPVFPPHSQGSWPIPIVPRCGPSYSGPSFAGCLLIVDRAEMNNYNHSRKAIWGQWVCRFLIECLYATTLGWLQKITYVPFSFISLPIGIPKEQAGELVEAVGHWYVNFFFNLLFSRQQHVHLQFAPKFLYFLQHIYINDNTTTFWQYEKVAPLYLR